MWMSCVLVIWSCHVRCIDDMRVLSSYHVMMVRDRCHVWWPCMFVISPRYFTSAHPRALLASLLLLPFALFPSLPYLLTSQSKLFHTIHSSLHPHRCISLFIPILAFISFYSILPHKELRFILPIVPMLNGIAAYGMAVMDGSMCVLMHMVWIL